MLLWCFHWLASEKGAREWDVEGRKEYSDIEIAREGRVCLLLKAFVRHDQEKWKVELRYGLGQGKECKGN